MPIISRLLRRFHDARRLNNLCESIARRTKNAVMDRLPQSLAATSRAQARGFIRARARQIVMRETSTTLRVANIRLSDDQRQQLVTAALEHAVAMALRSVTDHQRARSATLVRAA